MLTQLVKKNRSFRRFKAQPAPDLDFLENLISIARWTASTANRQPLRYVLVQEEKARETVFSSLAWAGYLKDWEGPAVEERPTAYIIILSDPELNKNPGIDVGLAAQTMLLKAREEGFGGCLLSSVQRGFLQKALGLPAELEIQLVLALGTPAEEVRLTDVEEGNIRYWRDADQIHYVPKRGLAELIVKKF